MDLTDWQLFSRVRSERPALALDDGEFICELNGFLEHTDEVKCEDGIPKSCMPEVVYARY